MRAIALSSRKSEKQPPPLRQPRNSSSSSSSSAITATSVTLGGATAWLITTLWGARGGTMAYAARSRAPWPSMPARVPAFAARFSSSLTQRGAVAGARRSSWSLSSLSSLSAVDSIGWRSMGGRAGLPGGGAGGAGGGALRVDLPAGIRVSALSMSSGGWSQELPGMGSGKGAAKGGGGRYSRRPLTTSARAVAGNGRSGGGGGGEGAGGGFKSAELLEMSYRDLQKLAKENKVRANQTVQKIVDELVALGTSDEDAIQSTEYVERKQQMSTPPPPPPLLASATTGDGLVEGVDKGDGWVTYQLDGSAASAIEAELGLDGDDYDDEEGEGGLELDSDAEDSMDARLRDAFSMNDRLSEDMLNSDAEKFGFGRDESSLEKLTITVPEGCCPGCGSKFQSEDEKSPGYLQADKLDALLGLGGSGEEDEADRSDGVGAGSEAAESEVDMDPEAWLAAQPDIDTTLEFDDALMEEDPEAWLESQSDMNSGFEDEEGAAAGGVGQRRLRKPAATVGGLGRAGRDAAALAGRGSAAGISGVLEKEKEGEVVGGGVEGEGWGQWGEAGQGEGEGVVEEEEEEKLTVCQRCFKLRFYGTVLESLRPGFSDSDLLTPQRFLVMLHYYANNVLEEEKSSTTAGASSAETEASSSEEEASSSPEIGELSSRAGALPQEVGVSLSGVTPAISPGDAHSTTAGAVPDVPHHETARTRPNQGVDDTFDNTHATGASGTNLSTACVEFTYTERDPFRISEEENRVIEIPNDILRCHPLHGSASPGITGAGITGAGIIEASSHGIFGATSSGSPSHIEAIAFGITGSTSFWITGASAGPTASHGTIGVTGSSPSGTTGPSAEPRVDGSTMSASPGVAPATFEPSLGAKLDNETDQEKVHTLTTAEGQPRENPETGSAESTQDDQEPLATSPAFVYTGKPTSGFLSILNEESTNIEAKTQRLAA
eukprot:jgi/Undpi1/7968/HiC_scaffold_24.g10440.m1